MNQNRRLVLVMLASCMAPLAWSQGAASCADLDNIKINGVEITNAASVAGLLQIVGGGIAAL